MIQLRPFSIVAGEYQAEFELELEHELLRQLVKKSPLPVGYALPMCTPPAGGKRAEPDAAFVVEGRVQCRKDSTRVGLQMTETASDRVVWEQRYSAGIRGLLDDADAVARASAEGILRAAIRATSRARQREAPENLGDCELAIRGIGHFYRRRRSANQRAIEYLTELSKRGTEALSVHAYLGRAHYRNVYYLWENAWEHSIEEVRRAAVMCLSIDDRDPAGPLLFALTRLFDGDAEAAVALADRVVSRWPNMPEARCLRGYFLLLRGDGQEAIRSLREAIDRKRPRGARGEYATALAAAYFTVEAYADARAMAQRAIIDNPNNVNNHVLRAISSWRLDGHRAVEADLRRIRRSKPGFSHRAFAGVLSSTPSHLRQHFFESLEGAGLIGGEWRGEREPGLQPAPSSRRCARPGCVAD